MYWGPEEGGLNWGAGRRGLLSLGGWKSRGKLQCGPRVGEELLHCGSGRGQGFLH